MSIAIAGGSRGASFEAALNELVSGKFASRLFAQDSTLWGDEAEAEAAIRLGWTDFALNAARVLGDAEKLRADFALSGIDRFVLSGMGGSSLAPLVISDQLTVLDSTHPESVRSALAGDLRRTAVVVSSKSGGTIETLSHRAAFEAAFVAAGIDPAGRIIVVTDPGSALETAARERGQRVFLADPHVGGRFSALTAYGIVPSVLSGADVATIVQEAASLRDALRDDSSANPALTLAAAIAAGLPDRFALEVRSSDENLQYLGLWIEQLVAESTGKNEKGVYPIALSSGVLGVDAHSATVQRVRVSSEIYTGGAPAGEDIVVAGPLGAQFLLWEVATAALGYLLKIDPFNQPDVEAAKIAARELFAVGGATPHTSHEPSAAEVLVQLDSAVQPDGYLAVQAFVSMANPSLSELLETLHAKLIAHFGIPVSCGFGPRYLHSTGQFQKGGPAIGTFLQFVDISEHDLEIPQSTSTFGQLLVAQAAGDAAVLRGRGRTVVTVATSNIQAFIGELVAELVE